MIETVITANNAGSKAFMNLDLKNLFLN